MVQSRSEPADKTPGSYRRPTRVFRIQGRKRAVQAAAEIIQEAVQRCGPHWPLPLPSQHLQSSSRGAIGASSEPPPSPPPRVPPPPPAALSYRELNESKMRGEFVQRQQIIRGVEFSYQPPPRANMTGQASAGSPARRPPPAAGRRSHG